MRLPNDTDRLKRLLADPQRVLAYLDLLDGAKRQARGFYILCPWHTDATPSCSVREGSDGTLALHCFGCSQGADVFDLIAKVHGLDRRRDFPRVLAEGWKILGEHATAPPPRRPAPPPRMPPPPGEVAKLWARCSPIIDDPDLSRQLRARFIDPGVVADRDFARALPGQGPLPGWACGESRWWRESHRCILPLWNPAGELASLHARAIQAAKEYSKGLLPAGYSASGLFLADSFGRQLIKAGVPAWWPRPEPPRLIITEGAIDFLTVASHYGDLEDVPAILGILSGSWSDALAQRIPSGCPVWIMTHGDEAGLKYRDRIEKSVLHRCPVFIERRAVGG